MVIKRSFYTSPEMEKYLMEVNYGVSDAMNTLLKDKDLNGVTEILANISLAYLLKDRKEVVPEDEEVIRIVKNEDAVADAIAAYASFVCAYNDNFAEADFEWLYEAVWRQYFKFLESRLDDYAFDGPRWKECWKNALFMS